MRRLWSVFTSTTWVCFASMYLIPEPFPHYNIVDLTSSDIPWHFRSISFSAVSSLTLYASLLDVSCAPHIRSGILVNSHALILQKEFSCTAGRIGLDLRDDKSIISKGGAIATGPAFLNALRCCVLIKRQVATI
ncbi:unnamed protein product [Macrosiphum euphorbiae]|uniref:Secreted protein n=1 Tax=Macrosiphum euphorbiae TaxID=13131 RepID=A0AAV0XWB0_9HEMI|nr:unnamed protein product [Macrosiphum euphorbiae]